MFYLFLEIWAWLLLATGVGLAAGWFGWGRQLETSRSRYRAKLNRALHNWEFVESRLTSALQELAAARQTLERRTQERDELAARLQAYEMEEAASRGGELSAPRQA